MLLSSCNLSQIWRFALSGSMSDKYVQERQIRSNQRPKRRLLGKAAQYLRILKGSSDVSKDDAAKEELKTRFNIKKRFQQE